MDVWQWVVLYATFLAVVQLLLYYYFRRNRDRRSVPASGFRDAGQLNGAVPNGRGSSESSEATEEFDAPGDAPGPVAEGVIVCPHCGARNEREPTYTYCRNCAAQLGA